MRHWTDQRTRAPRMAGLLAALLLLTYAPVAHAAPTLTATPTVVVFKSTTDVEVTKLDWNSGSTEAVQVHVKVDNGPFTPTGLAGPSGQKLYGLNYGKTYTFRLFGPNGRTIVSARDVVVTTKLVKPDIETGCALKCITEIAVDPHGTFADFTAATSVDATFVVQAFAAAPKSDGTCPSAPLAGTLWKPTPSKTFSGQMLHLDSATLHCYTVTAKDAGGNEQKVHKTFSTHRRFVTVTISTIHIMDDSDPSSSGEIGFDIDVHNVHDPGAVPEQDLAGGAKIHPNKTYTVANAPTAIKVVVFGSDDDGPIDTWENAEATVTLDVGGPGGPGEVISTPQGFISPISTPQDGSDLYFMFFGSFTVTYAP